MTRWAVRALAVLTMLLGGILLLPGVSKAATIETGWWWKANAGNSPETPGVPVVPAPNVTLPVTAPPPPAPPTADGGLQVAALPDGAYSVAAIRVDQELTSITLRLAENGDANGEQAKLVACQAFTDWEPVAGGPWDAKPAVACDLINGGGSVAGIRNDDGSWTFPVAPIAADGKTDFLIVPLADSDTAEGFAVPFQLVFAPPIEADMQFAATTAPPTDVTDPGTDTGTADLDAMFGDVAAYDELVGLGTTGSDAPAAPVVTPALDADDQAPVLPAFAVKPADNASQVLGAALVLAGLGAFFWASRQPTPPIASMLRGARVAAAAGSVPTLATGRQVPQMEAQLGGLGRFRRPRDGSPPGLQ